MSPLAEAGKGHLIVGGILVVISLALAMYLFFSQNEAIAGWAALGFGVFFFGVWGGVEIGRFLEPRMSMRG
jgi:hypothetical protein